MAKKPAAASKSKSTAKSSVKPEAKASSKAKPVAKKAEAKPVPKEAKAPKKETSSAPIEAVEPKQEKKAKKESKKEAAASSGGLGQGTPEEVKKWLALRDTHGNEKPAPYRMADQFSANSPLMHPRLGWGYIISNLNDRLEVLFESGTKVLISNYNPK